MEVITALIKHWFWWLLYIRQNFTSIRIIKKKNSDIKLIETEWRVWTNRAIEPKMNEVGGGRGVVESTIYSALAEGTSERGTEAKWN